jgi:hypothetical protein
MSELVQDLDQEFPFGIEEREILDESEIPHADDITKDDLNMKVMVKKLTNLAQKHIHHLNFLSQTSN